MDVIMPQLGMGMSEGGGLYAQAVAIVSISAGVNWWFNGQFLSSLATCRQ